MGIASVNTTPPVSLLYFATFPASQLEISSAEAFVPSRGTMYALGISMPSTLTPMTATSATSGRSRRRASSSAGATWLPLTFINSFIRSTMWKRAPGAYVSTYAMSPVFSHLVPSGSTTTVSRVASGFLQYPLNSVGPETHSSPGVLALVISVFPSSSISFAW